MKRRLSSSSFYFTFFSSLRVSFLSFSFCFYPSAFLLLLLLLFLLLLHEEEEEEEEEEMGPHVNAILARDTEHLGLWRRLRRRRTPPLIEHRLGIKQSYIRHINIPQKKREKEI